MGPCVAEWGVSHHRLWSKGLVSPFDRSLLLSCTWAHWGWRSGGRALVATQTSPEQLVHAASIFNIKGSQQIERQPTCTRPFTTAVCGWLSCLKLFREGLLSKIHVWFWKPVPGQALLLRVHLGWQTVVEFPENYELPSYIFDTCPVMSKKQISAAECSCDLLLIQIIKMPLNGL